MKIITFMKEMTGRISPDKSNNPDMNVTYYIQSFIIDILYIIIHISVSILTAGQIMPTGTNNPSAEVSNRFE
jgi:hypothetical protein